MKTALVWVFGVTLAALSSGCSGSAIRSGPPALPPTSVHAGTGAVSRDAIKFSFTSMDYPGLSNFNELLGINNRSHIVGYFGSGAASDPSSGYVIYPPYQSRNFRLLQYPLAAQTVATAANNQRTEAGYYVEPKGKIFSFTYTAGIWSSYQDPHGRGGSGMTEILSINDADEAVGTYRGGTRSGSFGLNITTDDFEGINPPHASSVVATGINGRGDLVGYWTQSGRHVGFLRKNGTYTTFSYPGSKDTEFLGITAHDYVVGSYVDTSGATHGFLLISPLWKPGTTWQSVDDPNAVGKTVATSVNVHKDIVGYYVDSTGATHGFLATPNSSK
jgi:hypothetical protein